MRAPKPRAGSGFGGLAASLPEELRSFDGWYYPNGLHDYMTAVSRVIGPGLRVAPVMEAAGLWAADWFRVMLERKTDAATA